LAAARNFFTYCACNNENRDFLIDLYIKDLFAGYLDRNEDTIKIVTRAIEIGELKAMLKHLGDNIRFSSKIKPSDFTTWASDNGFKIPVDLMASLNKATQRTSIEVPSMNRENSYYSEELDMAISVWTALYQNGAINRKRGPKKQIMAWLKEHYPKASQSALERVAIVVNPNKKGGAPSTD
jgi:hypothetical protein